MLYNKESKIIRKLTLISLLIITLTVSSNSQSKTSMPQSLKFSVLSVRAMSGEESLKRTPHFVGIIGIRSDTLAIRLRLSNDSNKGVYFLTFDGEIVAVVPLGFSVKQTDKGIIWRYGREGKREKSPGVASFTELPLKWILLPPHTAIEWEDFDSTLFQNEKHAFTIFTKVEETDEPLEVFSDFYTVPTIEKPKEK